MDKAKRQDRIKLIIIWPDSLDSKSRQAETKNFIRMYSHWSVNNNPNSLANWELSIHLIFKVVFLKHKPAHTSPLLLSQGMTPPSNLSYRQKPKKTSLASLLCHHHYPFHVQNLSLFLKNNYRNNHMKFQKWHLMSWSTPWKVVLEAFNFTWERPRIEYRCSAWTPCALGAIFLELKNGTTPSVLDRNTSSHWCFFRW